MPKKLISEAVVVKAAKSGQKTILLDGETLVTAAARDCAASLGIRFVTKLESEGGSVPITTSRAQMGKGEVIVIGSDHGGFHLKQALIPFLEHSGFRVVDVGTYTEESCDYPDYAYMVARMVSLGEATRGIMIDAVGVASAIVANKVPGIRAVCCTTEFAARSSREHNDANVLTLGGRQLGVEAAKAIVRVWLETWFGGGRHKARVDKISEIEKRFLK